MKKTTVVIVAIVIAIIIFICIFASGENKENTNNENINNTVINNEIINEMENEVIQNEIENVIENKEENTQEDEKQNEEENKQNTETFEEPPATAEQKVINIVKEDFKQINNVEVTVEGMNENGKYIVVVRDSKTTEALAFYTVDAASKTFTKKEMN